MGSAGWGASSREASTQHEREGDSVSQEVLGEVRGWELNMQIAAVISLKILGAAGP